MENCRDNEVEIACFKPNDDTIESVNVQFVTVFDSNGAAIANYYQDSNGDVIDPATYLGGGVLMLGNCEIKSPSCFKRQFDYAGVENSGVPFDIPIEITLPNNDGTTSVVSIPATANYAAQMVAWEAAFSVAYPDAIEILNHWSTNNGPSNAPAADMDFLGSFGRFLQFTVCPDDKMPIGATITASSENKELVGKSLITATDRSEVEYLLECYECGDELPPCVIPCGEDFPPLAEPVCQVIGVEEVCVATLIEDPEDDLSYIPELVDRDVFVIFTNCDGVLTSESVQIIDDVVEDYPLDPANYYADCETLQPIEDPLPKCPEGAVFNPVKIKGHITPWDNSLYTLTDGSILNHLANGENFEFTFAMDDGSSVVVQQTADPYFNNMIVVAGEALDCKIEPICANHTSPKGCNASHVANLAKYAHIYDTPTYPSDVQNNLNNPPLSEVWASAWHIICDCGPRPLSVTITNANTASLIGATKQLITRDLDAKLIYQSINCEGLFYKDCDGNDIAAPNCCPEPYEVEVNQIIAGAPIDICVSFERNCQTIESSGSGQASDWNDPLGSFEFFMNEEFGGVEVEVPTNASMATMTSEELERLFLEGIKLSADCEDIKIVDTVYEQTLGDGNNQYYFSMTICPVGPDECLKQTGWKGFVDLQTNAEFVVKTFVEKATLQNFCNSDGSIAFTKVVDSQGNILTDYTIVDCPEVDKTPLSSNTVCFKTAPVLKKTAYSVSDFDEGAVDVGTQACIEVNITAEGCTVENIEIPQATADGFNVTWVVGGAGSYKVCYDNFDGINHGSNWPIIVTISGPDGTGTITGGDLYWGSGGGETLVIEISSEILVKEFCFYNAPNEYQDIEGNSVDISELMPCSEIVEPVVIYDYELECVDGSLALVTITTTDGVPVTSSPVPIDPAVDCTNADDFELVRLCNTDGFVHVYAYNSSDLSTIIADVTTTESCVFCQPFDIVDYWKLEGGVAGVNGSRWRANSAPHGPVDTMFDGCGNHLNGDADEVIVYPNWNVVDTSTRFPVTGSDFGTSQEYYYSWVYFPQGVVIEDNNGNTGEFIAAYIGGKDQKPVLQKSVANTSSGNVGLGEIGSYPAGLYKVAIELSDFSVYGGVNIRWSLDGGSTFTPIPAANIYSVPPLVKCVKVRVNCDGTMETLDGVPFKPDAPNCSECEIKCPVIEDTTSSPDYEFQTVIGCDDIDGDPVNYVNITQETLIIDGVKTVTFFTDYGTDVQAEYTIEGTFVDCASGLPLEDPPIIVNCEDWEILTVYDAIGTNGVNVERWNANAITGESVNSLASDVFVGPTDYSGMPAHDNGAPDVVGLVEADLLILDNTNDQSQMRGWTYLYTSEPIRLREYHPRAEAVDYYLGKCCGPVVKAAVGPYPNAVAQGSVFDVSLPAGIHYIGFELFDFSAYSSVDYQYSTDNGATWARVPAAWLYTAKPRVTACQMKVCPETGLIADVRTGVLNTTASLCEPVLCVADGVVQTEGLQCAPQTYYKVNLPEQGTVEQQWIESAVNTSTSSGISYLASFSGTDAEGYPAHANGASDSTISSTIATTTNISNTGDDQVQSDFYIFLDKPTEIREFNPTAESSGVWISSCGSDQMTQVLDALYTNTQPNYIGLYQSGCYRVRLYHADISANGITRLQAKNDAGVWVSIPAYATKPVVEVVKGWYCDDGNNYNQDKSEVLDKTYLCEDPRCVVSVCCNSGSNELPLAIGRAV